MSIVADSLLNEPRAQADLNIKIIGVGGAGTNAVNALELEALGDVQLAAINTDAKALEAASISEKLMIGGAITRGLGAGGEVGIARSAAEADREAIVSMVEGVDLVVLVVGFGGGTGSAVAPIVAEIAGEAGALVLAFATLPFTFEGARRKHIGEEGLAELRQLVHGLIPLPNDILLQEGEEGSSVVNAFAVADQWIARGVSSLCGMLLKTGLINQDFGSLRSVFQYRGGKTVFGTGSATGGDYVADALDDLFICPLLHLGDRPAQLDRILVNVIGGADLGIAKLNEIMSLVSQRFGSREDLVFGAFIDPDRRESLEICVLGKSELELHSSRSGDASNGGATSGDESPVGLLGPSVHKTKLTEAGSASDAQDEFTFSDEDDSRGYFEKTDRNEYQGEDLDVPTYLRRGIKIKIKV